MIGEPIFQNKSHLYTRWDVQKIMEAMGTIQYREMYLPRVIVTENHKGGTGKVQQQQHLLPRPLWILI